MQSNKSSFLSEQDQSGVIANSLMLSQKREVGKVGVLESPYDAGNLAPSVLVKGEQMYKAQPYNAVNAAWPENVPMPTPQEALSGAKRLYRKFRGRAWQGKWKLTSGRRHTWPRHGVFFVNPEYKHRPGWPGIVHSISHKVHHQLYPNDKGHGAGHAFLEKEMIEWVIAQGWLEGKLKRPEKEKTKANPIEIRHQRVLENLSRWEAKLKRAQTALRKLNRQKKYYEKKAA